MYPQKNTLAVLAAWLAIWAGCATPPPVPKGFRYENVRTETSATIIQAGTTNFFSLGYGHGIAAATVDQIDGKEVDISYEAPVYIPAGKHNLSFRFVVSNVEPGILYQTANLELKAGETYRIVARYKPSPAPHVEFKLVCGDDAAVPVFQEDVPIIN